MLTNARAIHITLLLHETQNALNIIGSIPQRAHYYRSTISKPAKLKFSSLYCTYSGFVINDAVPILRVVPHGIAALKVLHGKIILLMHVCRNQSWHASDRQMER